MIKNTVKGIASTFKDAKAEENPVMRKAIKKFDKKTMEDMIRVKKREAKCLKELASISPSYRDKYVKTLNDIAELKKKKTLFESACVDENVGGMIPVVPLEGEAIEKKIMDEKEKEIESPLEKLEKEEYKEPETPVLEAANIDSEIRTCLDTLNAKGYKTKYSSAGHTKLRKKADKERDGVYYGKLYTDARLMFKADYKFPKAPKHWAFKTVDNCDYLYVVPITYKKADGTPDEAFAKWKARYMETLRTWCESLDSQKMTKNIEDSDGDTLEESVKYKDIYQEMVDDMLFDVDNDLL